MIPPAAVKKRKSFAFKVLPDEKKNKIFVLRKK
jgi:hypothetical protein